MNNKQLPAAQITLDSTFIFFSLLPFHVEFFIREKQRVLTNGF